MPSPERRPSILVPVPDGRVLAADDLGPAGGRPVVLVHGTPDSRLARHPDDSLLADLGVRLIALDRPGFGWSTPHDTATVASFGRDVSALADRLGLERFSLLAWSAGAVWALGAAAVNADRVGRLTVVGGLVPLPAYDDPTVAAAAGDARLAMVETAEELGATVAAELIAPMLVPDPPTLDIALEHLAATHDPTTTAELASVPGAEQQLAWAMLDAVRQGVDGLVRDVAVQLSPLDVALTDVTCPVRFVHGELDTACPPAFGRWFVDRLGGRGQLDVVAGAGHAVLLTRWQEILAAAADV